MERDVDALVSEHMPLVRAVARRAYPNLAWDPDLLQCGLIGLWQAARRWDGERPFRPFACTCIHNGMGHWVKTLNRWSTAPQEAPPEDTPGPEEGVVEDLDLLERIESAWPRGSREYFILTKLAAGRPKAEIAAALGRETWDITRISRRAWEGVRRKSCGKSQKPAG